MGLLAVGKLVGTMELRRLEVDALELELTSSSMTESSTRLRILMAWHLGGSRGESRQTDGGSCPLLRL